MDSIDLKIIRLLLENCRIPYRELGEKINLSINAVYNRIQKMINEGLILSFTATPTISCLKGLELVIYGKSNENLNPIIIDRLGQDEHVFFVGLGTNNVILINIFLKNLEEMQEVVSKLIKIAKMSDALVAIKRIPSNFSQKTLSPADYKILKVIKNDARMSYTDISEKVEISAKTIKKRILEMEENNLVNFSINFAPNGEGMIISDFHLFLPIDVDYEEQTEIIAKKYDDQLLYLQRFSNIPNLIIFTAIVKSNAELNEIYLDLMKGNYQRVDQLIIFNGKFFNTWREQLFEENLHNNQLK